MKTVLVIGAGRYQRRVIRRACELGLRVVAVDRNPDAPAFPEADVARVVDFADPDAVLAAVSDLEIDGVLTVQAERAVPIVARVAEALGLPGIGVDTARAMTHKPTMRRLLTEAGVPQPRFVSLRTEDELPGALQEVDLPAVLKPANASGQVGVARVGSTRELRDRLEAAVAASPTGEAILEQFVEGVEMNGIVVLRDGETLSVTLCDRLHPPGDSFGVSWIHLYPPTVEGERCEHAEQIAVDAARALGLETGIAFPQLIATPGGDAVVVECAARIGGMMAELIEHALGWDLLEVQIRLALGEELPDDLVRERFRRPAVVRFLTAAPGVLPVGRVTRVGPLEPVLACPGVLDAALYMVEGEVIRPVMNISDRRGYIIATGETREEALERADAAAALVEVEAVPDGSVA